MTAEQFKKLRQRLGYTQLELANRLGVHKLTVSQWETGRRKISNLVRLALKGLKPKRRS